MFLEKLILQRKVSVGSVLCLLTSSSTCVQSCFSPWLILGRCGILQRLQRWQNKWSVSEEPACKLGISHCLQYWSTLQLPLAGAVTMLGQRIAHYVSRLWVLHAGVGCLRVHRCWPGVRKWRKLEGASSHLFNPFLVPEPASQSSQVAWRNCKVISAFGAKIHVWT